jgi:hypothetical protein
MRQLFNENEPKNITGTTRLYTAKPSAPKTDDSKKDAITTLTDAMDEETQDILFSIKTYMNRTVETMKQPVSF